MPLEVQRLNALLRRADRNVARLSPRAHALDERIAKGKLRDPKRFYELAVALRALKRERLYVFLGHASFRAYLSSRRPMSRATAYRLLLVAEHLTAARARALGLERAVAAARKIARGEPVPKDAARLSSRDLAGRAPPSSEARRAASRLESALARLQLEAASAADGTTRTWSAEARRRGRGSTVVVTLDAEAAERLASALVAQTQTEARRARDRQLARTLEKPRG